MDAAVPVDEARLASLLHISEAQTEGFERRIGAMARDGQILLNRKGAILISDRADLISGRVQAHPDGFGFVVTGTGDDLFIGPREMNQVLHGDRVLVRPMGLDRRGRREATIVEVLERAQQSIVGRLYREHGVWFVVAADRRISQDILVEPESVERGGALGKGAAKEATGKAAKLKAGQVVTVELVTQPSRYAQPIGRIIEMLGDYSDPGMEIEIALRKHQLPFEFSKAAEREAAKMPEEVRKSDIAGREDLRDLPFVTIDGETARDFDDAVYAKRDARGGFKLYVAIADVGNYVRDGSALDVDARARGTSVYFPRRVIPMLPEAISNGLCSLNPNVDRLAMVCEMTVTKSGKINDFKFYAAVFRSQARLTYTQVARLLYDDKGGGGAPPSHVGGGGAHPPHLAPDPSAVPIAV
ncbi:MAG: RNB domain-containing ribonuclease, partial [Burkholderiales bacterium]